MYYVFLFVVVFFFFFFFVSIPLIKSESKHMYEIETRIKVSELGFGDIWPCNPIQPNWESEKTDAMNEKKAGKFFLWNQK